jgi:hypothetical protein
MARFLRGFILTNFSGLTNLSGSILKNLAGSTFKKVLIVAACALISALVPVRARAQHPGVSTGGGGHTAAPAPIAPPPVFGGARGARPGFVGPRSVGPRLVGTGPSGFPFRQRSIRVFPHRVFFGRPFLWFGVGLEFNPLWWPTCAPWLGWAGGFGCYSAPFYGCGFENYIAPYRGSEYLYVGGERDLIWLYLKDGARYGVTDYWLVNGQMHFSLVEDDLTKPAEHVVPYDEVDIQKTTYVNTRRGFRIVFRDEPWQQYLKDHPESTPSDVPPPQTK